MIDLHFHLLPGIDDGPADIDGAVELARAAARAGTKTVVATPHVSWNYPNDAATIARTADALRTRLHEEGVLLEVLDGAEIAMTRVADISPGELGRLRLGTSRWILLEPPFTAVAAGVDAIVGELQDNGNRVLLAHPERCVAFRRDPAMLRRLVEGGALTSVTAGSLVGDFGAEIMTFARELVREEMVHNVASDAHDLVRRPPVLIETLRNAGLEALTTWLTEGVPRALLDDTDLPPRPDVQLASTGGNRVSWWRRGASRFRPAW